MPYNKKLTDLDCSVNTARPRFDIFPYSPQSVSYYYVSSAPVVYANNITKGTLKKSNVLLALFMLAYNHSHTRVHYAFYAKIIKDLHYGVPIQFSAAARGTNEIIFS
jgi:hypothetical protein